MPPSSPHRRWMNLQLPREHATLTSLILLRVRLAAPQEAPPSSDARALPGPVRLQEQPSAGPTPGPSSRRQAFLPCPSPRGPRAVFCSQVCAGALLIWATTNWPSLRVSPCLPPRVNMLLKELQTQQVSVMQVNSKRSQAVIKWPLPTFLLILMGSSIFLLPPGPPLL